MSSDNITALTMPKWGLSMKEGKLLMWLIEEGSAFDKGKEIAEVETEKIASAVEAPLSGTLRKIVAKNDTVYPVGALLGVVAEKDVPDDEINGFIEKFQAEFIPEEIDEVEQGTESEFVEVNDLNIRYVSKGEGDEVIILIHGFGGDLDNWLFNHDVLVENTGKRVIALDLPGHGQSSKAVGNGSLSFFADTVHEFIFKLNISAVHLIGHSMGGAISLEFANNFPEAVLSIGLINPVGISRKINSDYINGFINGNSRKQIKPLLQLLFADKDLVTRQMINNILQYKRLDGVNEALTIIAEDFLEGDQQLYQLNHVLEQHDKIYIIKGGQDQIVPPDEQVKLPNGVTRILLENSGHMVQMESAHEVNDILVTEIRDNQVN